MALNTISRVSLTTTYVFDVPVLYFLFLLFFGFYLKDRYLVVQPGCHIIHPS